LRDPRLHSGEEAGAALRLPILCRVPHLAYRGEDAARRRSLIVQLDTESHATEVYRMIRTAIQLGGSGGRLRTLLVTSPDQGEGKSTVASNLALVLAQGGERTLLIDADLRHPSVHDVFGVDGRVGLSSVLRREVTLAASIQRTDVRGLDVLCAGFVPPNPSELLNSVDFGELLGRLSRHYSKIVLDSPPARLADPLILAAACDSTILVLRAGRSTRPACAAAYAALAGVGARFLGIVANDVRAQVPEYGSWQHAYDADDRSPPVGSPRPSGRGRDLGDDVISGSAATTTTAATATTAATVADPARDVPEGDFVSASGV
jgi:capsular exopolysaccharide synthesis family protein